MSPSQDCKPSVRATFIFCLLAVGLSAPLNIRAVFSAGSFLLNSCGEGFWQDKGLFTPCVLSIALLVNLACFAIPGILALLTLKERPARIRRVALVIVASLIVGLCLAQGILYERGPKL